MYVTEFLSNKNFNKKNYAYCGNTSIDLDPLTVSRTRLSLVEQALFE